MTKNISRVQQGAIALIVVAALQSCMGIWARYLNNYMTLYQQVLLRVCAGLGIGLLAFRKQVDLRKFVHLPIKDIWLLYLRGCSFFLIAAPLFTLAINQAKYTNIAFIDALPMTAVLGVLFLSERPTISHIFYLLLAFVGVMLISLQDLNSFSSWGKGEWLELFSLFFFGINYIARKWHTNYLNNFEIALGSFACAIPLLALTTLILDGYPSISWQPSVMIVILVAGAFNIAIAYLVNFGFDRVPAVMGSNLLNTQPIFALLVALLLYSESPVAKEVVGGLIIIFSSLGMTRLKQP